MTEEAKRMDQWRKRFFDFTAYMRDCGWRDRPFMMIGNVFHPIGILPPRLANQPIHHDNDNQRHPRSLP